ncbi:MAG: hypothetical protein QM651_18265 [Rhodoblastus sp.]
MSVSDRRHHDHAQGHGHAHVDAPDHHGHAHDPSSVVAPGPSLLRLSAVERLAGASVICAFIWLGVKWAMA